MIGSAFSIASMKKTKQASKPGQKNRAPLTGNPILDAIASSPKPEKGSPPKTFFQKEAAAVESEGRKKAYSKAKSTRGSMENAMAQVDKQLGTGSNPYDPRRMAIKSALWGTGPSPKTVSQFDLESMIRDAKAGNLSKIIERGQSNRDRRAGFQDAMDQVSAEPQPDTGIKGLIDRLGVEKAMQIIDVVGGYKQGGIGGAMSGASQAVERLMPTNLARASAEGYAGGRDFRANPDESTALKLGVGLGNLGEYISPIGAAKVANDVINTAGQVISRKSLKPVYESLIEAPIEGVKTALDPSKPVADRILGGLGTAAMALGAAHGVRKGVKIAKSKGWIGVTAPEPNVGATLTKEVSLNGKGQEKGQVENPVLNWSVGPSEAPAAIPNVQPATKVNPISTIPPSEVAPRRTGLTPEIMADYYDAVYKDGVGKAKASAINDRFYNAVSKDDILKVVGGKNPVIGGSNDVWAHIDSRFFDVLDYKPKPITSVSHSITGNVHGEPFWSDGNIAIITDSIPKTFKETPKTIKPHLKPESANRVFGDGSFSNEVRAVGSMPFREAEKLGIVLSDASGGNSIIIDHKYYSAVNKMYDGKAKFYFDADSKALKIVVGGKRVGVVMPLNASVGKLDLPRIKEAAANVWGEPQVENPVLNWSVGPSEAPAAIPNVQPTTKVNPISTIPPSEVAPNTSSPKPAARILSKTQSVKAVGSRFSDGGVEGYKAVSDPNAPTRQTRDAALQDEVAYWAKKDGVAPQVGRSKPIKPGVDADLKSGEPRQLFAGDLPDSVTTKAKRGVDPYSKIARGEGVQVVEGSGATDYSGAYYGKTKTKPYGEIRLTPGADDITRAHEVAHAIDAVTSPTGRTGRTLYEILGASQGEQKVIRNEMLDITKRLVGESEFNSNPKYYSKPAELWARFLQAHAQNPLLVDTYAPRSAELLDSLAKKHPAVSTYLDVAKGKPLEGKVRALAPDKRQQYRKDLGDYLGNKAYSADVGYKAAAEYETHRIGEMWRSMADGVKDSPKDLMIAAEGIKTNAGGKFEFGTTDRVVTTKESEAAKLEDMGYQLTDSIVDADGGEKFVYTRARYTPDEAKANYEKLTPEGKHVIDQWTKTRLEATSEFNRHVQAELAQVDETIEGYVSHVLQQNKTASQWAKSFFKTRTAGFRKHRTGAEGYVEDFWKQTQYQAATSALEKLWNVHMPKQLARVAERVPLDEIKSPAQRKGWTLVEGNLDTGLYEVAIHKFKHGATRYWIPNTVWDAYKIGTGQMEVTGAAKIAQGAMRYWSLNALAHPGSVTTNAISGGMQLGTKWIEDFYLDALGEKGTRNRTKSNLKAVLKVMSKGGWKETPDWVYGGKMGGMHGIFDIESTGFWHKVMGPYRAVEDFYKRIIARAELDKMGVSVKDLESLLKKSELDEFNRIIGEIDKSVDAAAYNYQNVPGWLSNSKYSTAKSLVKPFAIYPYKAIKQFIRPFEMLADGNYSANEKAAAMLAMATVVSTYVAAKRRINAGSNLDTRAGDEKLPGPNRRLQVRGGVAVGKNKGEERVINLSKYTPLIFAEMVDSLIPARQKDGQWGVDIDQLQSAITDLLGGVGPAAQVLGEVVGMRSKYDAYKSPGAVVGGAIGSFIPFARIQKDINDLIGIGGKAVRKAQPKTFSEAILQNIVGLDQRKARKDYKGVSENIRSEVLHRLLMGLRERYVNPIEQREAIYRNKVNKAKNEGR